MSESNSPTRGDLHHPRYSQQPQQQQHHLQEEQLHQSSSQCSSGDEHDDDANSSIIGKVKSRVSSIFPHNLTKWFSPSTSQPTATASNGGLGRRKRHVAEQNELGRRNDDEESDTSEEESSPLASQPPRKRFRLNAEESKTHFDERKYFLSSTPTLRDHGRAINASLYHQQKGRSYDFLPKNVRSPGQRSTLTRNSLGGSTDIDILPDRNTTNSNISSRRCLNLPSTVSASDGYGNEQQSIANLRAINSGPSSTSSSYAMQRKPTIIEVVDEEEGDEDEQISRPENTTIIVDDGDEESVVVDVDNDNDDNEEIVKATAKNDALTNGTVMGRSNSVASESADSRSSSLNQGSQSKTGIYNTNNRLRGLSGNSLNFFSHLEGRKSLFSGKNMSSSLNNSTLSLSSLTRRQFNSSIYGSTSALSDSRLLNTSSPFYKGQTTYGGAAAYNKFNQNLNNSATTTAIKIRPTSSLSSLSSSTHSLAQGNESSNMSISSTAKRILELINEFSTPLGNAKKMASNIKTPAMLASRNSIGKRFGEADLSASRGMRLQSVRSPYSRPAVVLNSSKANAKKDSPPVQELQVPTMSQLVEMKKFHNCTERSRQIANTATTALLNRECEYKLPQDEQNTDNSRNNMTKHTGKIRNKVTAPVRARKIDKEVDETPPPVNLPNIPFPQLTTMPKIDISLKCNIPSAVAPNTNFKFDLKANTNSTDTMKSGGNKEFTITSVESLSTPSNINFNFTAAPTGNKQPTAVAATDSNVAAPGNQFKFSSPIPLSDVDAKFDCLPVVNNFKFSPPIEVTPATTNLSSASTLNSGSGTNIFKSPHGTQGNVGTIKDVPSTNPAASNFNFGEQFKKSSEEWECSVCLVSNKNTATSCIACTVPRKGTTETASSSTKNSFGDMFKPQGNTWECSSCMVRNKDESKECVACNTKKPNAIAVTQSKTSLSNNPTSDEGFKSLIAQQTASKWECDACMTRNDADHSKCVCCEQVRPGSKAVNDNVPKFCFGASATPPKFTFGFNTNAKSEDSLRQEMKDKTDPEPAAKPFTFGFAAKTQAGNTSTINSSATNIFGNIFGAKQSTPPGGITKDVSDTNKITPIGFKFGMPPSETTKTGAVDATKSFSFGVKTDTKPSNMTFNLQPTAAENKSNDASKPTSIFGSVTSAPNQKTDAILKTSADKTKSPGMNFSFGAIPSSSSMTTAGSTISPIKFGITSTSESNKTSNPLVASPAVSNNASAVSKTPATFSFKPDTTTKSVDANSTQGFSFGTNQSNSKGSIFGSLGSTSASPLKMSTFPSSTNTSFTASKPDSTFKPDTTTKTSSSSGFTFGTNQFSKPIQFGSTTVNSPSAATTVNSQSTGFTFATHQTSKPIQFGSPPLNSTSSNKVTSSTASGTTTTSNPIFGFNPNASATSSNPTPALQSNQANNASFTFGSLSASSPATAPSTSKPTFGNNIFGASASSASVFGSNTTSSFSNNIAGSIASTTVSTTSGTAATPFAFGSGGITGSSNPPQNTFKSILGNNSFEQPSKSISGTTDNSTGFKPSGGPIFGQSSVFGAPQGQQIKSNPPSSQLFGSNSAPSVPQLPAGNPFGSPSSTPGFGASSANTPLGQNASASPAFGSMIGSSTVLSGGFGSAPPASSGDVEPPIKRPNAFNFGSGETGGFAFNANNNNKPADTGFKFNTSVPSFNFTGSSEPISSAISSISTSISTSENACSKSSGYPTVDSSCFNRKWLRPNRDDGKNTNTEVIANAISSSKSLQYASASTTANNPSNQDFPGHYKNVGTWTIEQQQHQPQKDTPFKRSFLNHKYKIVRNTKLNKQNINSSTITKNSNEGSDGSGADDNHQHDHHNNKQDMNLHDNINLSYHADQFQPQVDEKRILMKCIKKTGDKSTKTNPVDDLPASSQRRNIRHWQNERMTRERERTQDGQCTLPYKLFVLNKYKLIRKNLAKLSDFTKQGNNDTTSNDPSGGSTITDAIQGNPLTKHTNFKLSLLSGKEGTPGNRASVLVASPATTASNLNMAKYKYFKTPAGTQDEKQTKIKKK